MTNSVVEIAVVNSQTTLVQIGTGYAIADPARAARALEGTRIVTANPLRSIAIVAAKLAFVDVVTREPVAAVARLARTDEGELRMKRI